MSAVLKQPKPRKCKAAGCDLYFVPFLSTQKACSTKCAIAISRAAIAKQERKEERAWKREGRERLKTISKRLQEAQRAFNAWIRWRDRNEPCISCGTLTADTWHAGHYKPAGANAALRFNALNVHRQCEPCNTWKSGDLVSYRVRLVAKIGLEAVERLEGPQPEVKWTHDQLIAIRREYQRRLREDRAAA